MKSRIAVPDLLYVKPLLYGLEKPDSPFEIVLDIPSKNSIKLNERSENIRSAFLSPIDYARHGADYCIVPEICAASSVPSHTIQLFIKSGLRNIERVAIDIRFTSEIILTKIILEEKYRSISPRHSSLQFIPMKSDVASMLATTDAVLVINSKLEEHGEIHDTFMIDLVEEWTDLTDLPYVHGFWVGRDEEMSDAEADALLHAQRQGIVLQNRIAEDNARVLGLDIQRTKKYLQNFSYSFGEQEIAGLEEFVRYAYYHGVIGDVPEIRFFDLSSEPSNEN